MGTLPIYAPLPLLLPKISPSLTSFTLRSPLAHYVCTLKQPVQQQEEYASPVQSVSEWRKQATAEKSAGLEAPATVLVSLFECDICGIHVGPGYTQQELFLCPVRRTTIINEKPIYYEAALLLCDGECARHRRRLLPEWLRIVEPAMWETTMLLCDDPGEIRPANRSSLFEMKRIYAAIRQVVLASAHLFFLVSTLVYGLSASLFFRTHGREEPAKQQQQSTTLVRGQVLAFSRVPRRHPLTHYVSTPVPTLVAPQQRSIAL